MVFCRAQSFKPLRGSLADRVDEKREIRKAASFGIDPSRYCLYGTSCRCHQDMLLHTLRLKVMGTHRLRL